MEPTSTATEVRSASCGQKTEVGVESLQFGEEIQTLMSVPPETGSSFTALLELPANQAVKLLHSPEKLSGEVWSNGPIEHPKPYHFTPMFPSNTALVDRASKFSVFATTENSPEPNLIPSNYVKQEPVESDSRRNSSPGLSDSVVPNNDQKSSKRKEREKKVIPIRVSRVSICSIFCFQD